MKILVCLRQVPGKDAPLKIAAPGPDGRARTIRPDINYEINEPDTFALEEALRQKEAHAGEVVALTVGPERAAQALREALAKGADRALHVEGEEAGELDAYAVAEAITRAIAGESFDLIVTGLQSDDRGYGQTGVILAELLGAPHASIVMEIDWTPGHVRVKRELEGGRFQYVEMPTPAVLTIQSGLNQPRYATLMGIKQARTKPLTRMTLEELGVGLNLNRQTLVRLFAPSRRAGSLLFEGTPKEQAEQLAARIEREVAR